MACVAMSSRDVYLDMHNKIYFSPPPSPPQKLGASNRTHTNKSPHAPPGKRKSDINMTQAVDSSGIWKNMVRKLEAPLQSPRRRGRFKPTPLDPVIVEEESRDLISPRSLTVDVNDLPPLPVSEETREDGEEDAPPLSATNVARYQVTSV